MITTTLILYHTSANPARHRGIFHHLQWVVLTTPDLYVQVRGVEVDLAPEGPAHFEELSFRWIITFQLSSWRHHPAYPIDLRPLSLVARPSSLYGLSSVFYSFLHCNLFRYL